MSDFKDIMVSYLKIRLFGELILVPLIGQAERNLFSPTGNFQGTRTAVEKDKGITLIGVEQEQR